MRNAFDTGQLVDTGGTHPANPAKPLQQPGALLGTYTGNLFIGGDLDVTLSGGFADCASAAAGQLPTTPVRSNLRSSAAFCARPVDQGATSAQRQRARMIRAMVEGMFVVLRRRRPR